MKRILLLVEGVFLATFWWQTRYNLVHVWPGWMSPLPTSDYLIPFLYLSDVALLLLILVWSIESQIWDTRLERLWSKDFWLSRQGFLIGIFGFLLVEAAVSIVVNDGGAWSWYRWFKLMEGGLIGLWVYQRWRGERVWWYGGILLLGLGLESLLLIGEWIRQGSLGLQGFGEWRFSLLTPGIAKVVLNGREYLRPMGTFAHPNIAAAMLVLGLGGGILGYRAKKDQQLLEVASKKWYWIFMAWVLVIMAGIAVAFSRTGWLAGGFLIGWWGLYEIKSQNLKVESWKFVPQLGRGRLTWLMIGGAVLLVGLCATLPLAWQRFWSLSSIDAQSADLRWQLAAIGWQVWLSKPWLGVGLNQFVLSLRQYGPLYGSGIWLQPVHNLWLLVADEIGVLGLAGVVGLISGVIGPLCYRKRKGSSSATEVEWMIMGMWVVVLGLSLFDHYWWTSQQAFLSLWGLGGGTLYLVENKRRREL